MPPSRKQDPIRLLGRIARLRDQGLSTKEIAEKVGKSRRRVQQILSLMPEKIRYGRAG